MTGQPGPASGKLCPSCGTSVPVDSNICLQCGYNFNAGPYAQPPRPVAGPGYAQPNWQANYPRQGYDQPSSSADGMAIAGLVLGILALPGVCLCYLNVPLSILAFIFGGLGLKGKNRGMAIAGMICAGISLVMTVGLLIFIFVGGFSSFPGGTYPR